jgi:phage terminase large subunit-like protein
MKVPEKIPYCPYKPTGTQRLFLGRDTREVFFGGAAGGGKSVALLMGALRYVQQPGYAALIIRKDLPRLELAGGLIARSHEWFAETEARWKAGRRTWVFPIEGYRPATLTFGYLSSPLDKFRYASSEFQYIAFDELTDFLEEDYLFLFSRLRRSTGVAAKLRMRSASNPGGVGRLWVKRRFIEGAVAENKRGTICMKDGRCYIPSRIADNPHLNGEEYRQTLAYLPPLERERLMNGDWDVQPDGLIQASYLRYFVETKGQMELLGADGRSLAVVPEGSCYRFVTIDPAGTSADRAREIRGHGPSWTVIQVWDQPRRELANFLLLREQVRERVAFDKLCELICGVAELWEPARLWIEGEKLGQAVVDQLRRKLPIDVVPTRGQDKTTRAGPLILKLSRGEVFLPRDENSWRMELEAEWLAWTGDERQPSDQIDAAAYAAIVGADGAGEVIRLLG